MTQSPQTDTGQFETQYARKYLQQMCKHFAHKADVTFTADEGKVQFSGGSATMRADDRALSISVVGDDLEKLRFIIDKHLERFAFREEFQNMDWATSS